MKEPQTTDGGPAVLNETLRDRFAMAAVTGMLAARPSTGLTDAHEMATGAYIIADAMLRAREEN